MSAQPRVNRPDVQQEVFTGTANDDPARHQPRHLFSPFLDIPTRFERYGFAPSRGEDGETETTAFVGIRQGVIRSVRDYTYSVPDKDAIVRAFDRRSLQTPQSGTMPWTASAAEIVEGVMRTNAERGDRVPTGLVILNHLQNIDPLRSDHFEFLALVNALLWPENFETSEEHKNFLKQIDLTPVMQFPADLVPYDVRYPERDTLWRVERTVAQLLDEAIPRSEAYCRAEYRELADDLKAFTTGGPQALGTRKEADPATRKACRWLALPEPVKPVTALDAIYGTAGGPGLAGANNSGLMAVISQQIEQQNRQAEQQGKVLEVLAQKIIEKEGTPETGVVDLLASFGDMMRSNQALNERNQALMERLVAKETAASEENEEAVAPKQTGGKSTGSKQKNRP